MGSSGFSSRFDTDICIPVHIVYMEDICMPVHVLAQHIASSLVIFCQPFGQSPKILPLHAGEDQQMGRSAFSLAPRRTVGTANHCSCGKCQLLSPRGFGGTVIPTGGRVRLRAQGPRSGGIGCVRIRKYLGFKGGGGVETNLRMIWAASAGNGRGWEMLISH